MRTQLTLALLATTLACPLFAMPAQAQRARVFVSVNGNDANPCTGGSPCKTFQHAHDVVLAGGEISVLDTGGYGTIIISKAISIVAVGVEASIATTSGQTAITIMAGTNDKVSLQGLTLDAANTGQNGVEFDTGGALTIKDSVIRNFVGAGVYYIPTAGGSEFLVSDTLVADNKLRGIHVLASGAVVGAAFYRVVVSNNGSDGFFIESTGLGGITATVSESVVANNGGVGFNASGSSTNVSLFHSIATNNLTGLQAASGVDMIIAQCHVTENGQSWNNTATMHTFGDNYFYGGAIANAGILTSVAKQ